MQSLPVLILPAALPGEKGGENRAEEVEVYLTLEITRSLILTNTLRLGSKYQFYQFNV